MKIILSYLAVILSMIQAGLAMESSEDLDFGEFPDKDMIQSTTGNPNRDRKEIPITYPEGFKFGYDNDRPGYHDSSKTDFSEDDLNKLWANARPIKKKSEIVDCDQKTDVITFKDVEDLSVFDFDIDEKELILGSKYPQTFSGNAVPFTSKTLESRPVRIDGHNYDRGEGLPYRIDDPEEQIEKDEN